MRLRSAKVTLCAVAALVVAAASPASGAPGDWPMFRFDPTHSGTNPAANAVTPANVATLAEAWTAQTGGFVSSSPAVVNGVVYVGSFDNKLYAFDAAGVTNCSGMPTSCQPLWTAATGNVVFSSPAVVDGVVYVGSSDGILYAFDAAGVTNCGGLPKICQPLWIGPTGIEGISSSPVVAGGVVYVGSNDNNLYAFDADGVTNCVGAAPVTCSPLWIGPTGGDVYSSPAVANGVVYVGSFDQFLYAFDAAGVTNCTPGTPTVCQPLWKALTGNQVQSSPTVAGGLVYVGSNDSVFYAFDAAGGAATCTGTMPKLCGPVWFGTTGSAVQASPAVSGGVVYVPSTDGFLYAFDADAAGANCAATTNGLWCDPLWRAAIEITTLSSPAVAGGLVFLGGGVGGTVYAFHAAGSINCSGSPPNVLCAPLWTASAPPQIVSSPAVVGGSVYIGSIDGKLHVYRLPFVPLPDCAAPPTATITGTNGNEILNGTPGPDVIDGRGGRDQIFGAGGDDVILGGDGDDVLVGGDGNDTLCGGNGNDSLRGSNGDDRLFGQAGSDTLRGEAGTTDTCDGGPGSDGVPSGAGCETITGVP